MWIAKTQLKSVSPYSPSRNHNSPKKEKESHADYEKRTWREKAHFTDGGIVVIPQMAFKLCLEECAKYLSIQIKGKGKSTYTKHFTAGVLVTDPLPIGIKKDDLQENELFLPADGQRGGGKRVWKSFPIIHEWEGTVLWHILDQTVTEEVFLYHIKQAGMFIGLGSFRPRNGGYFGRFEVVGHSWSEVETAM